MKTIDEKREFYSKCSQILNIEHEFHVPVPRRTRWNTRRLGNGRYPGFGVIQCYGSMIRVMSKRGTHIFSSYEEVYSYLLIVVDTTA